MLTGVIKTMTKHELQMEPVTEKMMPGPKPGMHYMLYMHIPFCERLCPYCSFNRYPFREEIARPYFKNLRRENCVEPNRLQSFHNRPCFSSFFQKSFIYMEMIPSKKVMKHITQYFYIISLISY